MILTANNSRILNLEATLGLRRVRFERHKQGSVAGNKVSRQCGSAESAHPRRRVILPVVHCDFVKLTGDDLLNVECEELQFNYLQTDTYGTSINYTLLNLVQFSYNFPRQYHNQTAFPLS